MHPTLIDAFGYKFHAYPTMLAVAFLTCTLLAVREAQRRNPPIDATPQGGLWAFIGGLLGAKIYWILQYSEPKYLWRAFFVWEGGLVFYGGLIGGIFAVYVYIRVNDFPVRVCADIVAPYLALGEAITRLGCFLNGCCWGAPANVPWAVSFPKNSHVYWQQVRDHLITGSETASLPVHPTQLYMTAGLLLAMALMMRHEKTPHVPGATGALYLFFYGVVRFTVEMFRGDSARSVMGMTVSEAISLGLVFAGAALFLYLRRLPRPAAPESAAPEPAESVPEVSEDPRETS
ncbi:MAG TPA: prolipoprotein diacylglyceryl transferase [Candidatus Hydrogenedentes bacterium]|nr:prolipoprotein diacylglyceryl transferase [Candidatus Hydrogenedentota bacterium]HRT21252.1 prolipoprotein diacylglyceryl transferase [Candidatus Hydrogenedentota bacterium]HRT65114.1 prolipoprotein diacylglyceryl transferase [Candidatus Hydrogenedentota bacterium]